ncbi:hypothetical protein D3C77_701680 [compost metagenome]
MDNCSNVFLVWFSYWTLGLGGYTMILMTNAETIPTRISVNRVRANSHCPDASMTATTVTRVTPIVSPIFKRIQIMITSMHTRPTAIGSLENIAPPAMASTAPRVFVCS